MRIKSNELRKQLGNISRERQRQLEKLPEFPKPIFDQGSPTKFFVQAEVDSYLAHLRDLRDSAGEQALNEGSRFSTDSSSKTTTSTSTRATAGGAP